MSVPAGVPVLSLRKAIIASSPRRRIEQSWGQVRAGVAARLARLLNLWANGRLFGGTYPELTVDVPVSGGEVVLCVGMILPAGADGSGYCVPFKLATAIRSEP